MSECVTNIDVKNVKKEEFEKWFDKKAGLDAMFSMTEEGFNIEIDYGWAGYFWESLSLQMVSEFKDIVFYGINQLIMDDHIVDTRFSCDGKEIVLSKGANFPEDYEEDEYYDEEDDDYNEYAESLKAEYADSDSVKFLVSDIPAFMKIRKETKGKLRDENFVEAVCNENKISVDAFRKFSEIYEWKKRR